MARYPYKPVIGTSRALITNVTSNGTDSQGHPRYRVCWDDAGLTRSANTRGPLPSDLAEIVGRLLFGQPSPARIVRNGHGSITEIELRRDLLGPPSHRAQSADQETAS